MAGNYAAVDALVGTPSGSAVSQSSRQVQEAFSCIASSLLLCRMSPMMISVEKRTEMMTWRTSRLPKEILLLLNMLWMRMAGRQFKQREDVNEVFAEFIIVILTSFGN